MFIREDGGLIKNFHLQRRGLLERGLVRAFTIVVI